MLGFIPPPPTDALRIGGLTIHFYGMLIALGAYLGATTTRKRFVDRGGNGELADRVTIWGIVAGIFGARAAYVSTHFGNFHGQLLHVIFIWEGGLAFFGGLVAGTAVIIWLLRRNGADVIAFAEACTPALPLAQAIGRWGNYFNQELYGTPTRVPWALRVDPVHRVAKYTDSSTFHPTFLYESLLNIGLVLLILRLDHKKTLRRGALPFVYLAGYGAVRFGMELLRTDTTWRLFGISRNGYVSALAVIIGVVGLIRIQRDSHDAASGESQPEERQPEERQAEERQADESRADEPTESNPSESDQSSST